MIALHSPAFAGWSSSTLVTDAAGPALAFHATSAAPWPRRLPPFQHFGTLPAAMRRAWDRRLSRPHVVRAYLDIRRPLDVIDDEAANSASSLLQPAVRRGEISQWEATDAYEAVSARSEEWGTLGDPHFSWVKWQVVAEETVKLAASKGYDGFRYENRIEGGVSWIPFRTDQVWWAHRRAPEP